MKVPKLGNIWIGGELIGFRDFTTGVFTPVAGKENWSLVDDVLCNDSPILEDEDTGLVLYDEDTQNTVLIDEDML
jgi:hypothetical protein